MTDIHIERWGAAGERVILIHGGAQGTQSAGHTNFWAQEPLASEGWRLVVPDRPGHGRSPHPGRGDDAVEDARWVADLLDEEPAHVLGHSFGGLVALAAAAARPAQVRSLTLIEPALLKVAAGEPAVRKLMLAMAVNMMTPFRSPATKAVRAMKLLGIPDKFDLPDEELTAMGRALGKGKFPPKAEMEGWLEMIRREGVPLQVLAGNWSPAFMAICEVAAAKGGGTSAVVPSAHHFPQWAGASFNAKLTDFWRRADAGAQARRSSNGSAVNP